MSVDSVSAVPSSQNREEPLIPNTKPTSVDSPSQIQSVVQLDPPSQNQKTKKVGVSLFLFILLVIFVIVSWYAFNNLLKQIKTTALSKDYDRVIKTGFWLNILSMTLLIVWGIALYYKFFDDITLKKMINLILIATTADTIVMFWLMGKLPASVSKKFIGIASVVGSAIFAIGVSNLLII